MLEKSVHDCKCLILFRNFFTLKNVAASSIPLLQSFALLSSQFLWTKLLAMGLTRRKVFDSYGKNVIAQYSCKTDFSPSLLCVWPPCAVHFAKPAAILDNSCTLHTNCGKGCGQWIQQRTKPLIFQ
jgi:hypothetical protein